MGPPKNKYTVFAFHYLFPDELNIMIALLIFVKKRKTHSVIYYGLKSSILVTVYVLFVTGRQRVLRYAKEKTRFFLLRAEGQKADGADQKISIRILVRQINVDV